VSKYHLKSDPDEYFWNPNGIDVHFVVTSDDPTESLQTAAIRIKFKEMSHEVTVSGAESDIHVFALPGKLRFSTEELRVNDRRRECSEPLEVLIQSPFAHSWAYYQGQTYKTKDIFFPAPIQNAIDVFLSNTDKKVLWISGGPGYGKSFLLNYIEQKLTSPRESGRDLPPIVVRLDLPLKRGEILALLAKHTIRYNTLPDYKLRFGTEYNDIADLLNGTGPIWYLLIDNAYKCNLPDIVFELMYLAIAIDSARYSQVPPLKLVTTDELPFDERLGVLQKGEPEAFRWLKDHEDNIQSVKMPLWSSSEIGELFAHHTQLSLNQNQRSALYKASGGHPYLLTISLDKWKSIYRRRGASSPRLPSIKKYGKHIFERYCHSGFLKEEERRDFFLIQAALGEHCDLLRVGNPQPLLDKGLLVKVAGRYCLVKAFTGVRQ